jgi:hypothetical protein
MRVHVGVDVDQRLSMWPGEECADYSIFTEMVSLGGPGESQPSMVESSRQNFFALEVQLVTLLCYSRLIIIFGQTVLKHSENVVCVFCAECCRHVRERMCTLRVKKFVNVILNLYMSEPPSNRSSPQRRFI